MDWRDMINGGKAALALLVFTVAMAVVIGINSFVGLFVGGALESAAISSSFYYVNASNTSQGLTTVGSGFNTSVANLITNLGSVQTPFTLWTSLLSVILILAVFAGFVYLGYQTYKKSKGGASGSGSDMGY